MLLRNIPDSDIFTAMSLSRHHTPQQQQRSPSPLPSTTYHSMVSHPEGEEDQIRQESGPALDDDDVWGNDDDYEDPSRNRNLLDQDHQNETGFRNGRPGTAMMRINHHHHPSDVPRLRREHSTAGYRDGITAAKATSVQAGFDEGYGLGATIGLCVGELLGVLEGLAAATQTRHGQHGHLHRGASGAQSSSSSTHGGDQTPTDETEGEKAERRRLRGLLAEARKNLSVQAIFSPDYWAEDGTWKYRVPGDGETVFADVAAAHPLVRKWDAVVKTEAGRYGVDWDVWKEGTEEERRREEMTHHGHGRAAEKKGEIRPVAKGKAALEW